MDLKKTGNLNASQVMQDDWFKLAGNLYRVVSARTRFIDETEIVAVDVNDRSTNTITLTVKASTPFTIYNQK